MKTGRSLFVALLGLVLLPMGACEPNSDLPEPPEHGNPIHQTEYKNDA